jgi:TetR/AcrR family transcriptional regulator
MKKRAVTNEQKTELRQEILDITKKRFLQADFHNIKMADIAKAAGIAKGTLFFYYKTKEELFLALAKQVIESWHNSFDKILREQLDTKKKLSLGEFESLVMSSFKKDNALIPLFAILDDTLENNIDIETAYLFKSFITKRMIITGNLIEQIFPFIKKGDGSKMLFYTFMLIVGVFTVTNPSPVMEKVLKKPGMEIFNMNFNDVFPEILSLLLSGYEHSKKIKN